MRDITGILMNFLAHWSILLLQVRSTTELEEIVAEPSTPLAVPEDEGFVVDGEVKALLSITLEDIEKMESVFEHKDVRLRVY